MRSFESPNVSSWPAAANKSRYGVVYKHVPASEKKRLKAEQRGWVKGRNDCWKSGDQRGCVKRSYDERIGELKDR